MEQQQQQQPCNAAGKPSPPRLKVRMTEKAVAESRPVLISSAQPAAPEHKSDCQSPLRAHAAQLPPACPAAPTCSQTSTHTQNTAQLTHEENWLLPHQDLSGGQPLALAAADAAHLGGPHLRLQSNGRSGGYVQVDQSHLQAC